MISGDNRSIEAALIVEEFAEENITIGFLGFGPCEGLGKRDFKTNGPQESSIIPVKKELEFTVSVWVEYEEKDKKK